MSKLQIAVLVSAAGLFLLIYFTCSTKPPSQKAIEKSRAIKLEQTDISSLLAEARAHLETRDAAAILSLEAELDDATGDSARTETFKALSGRWYAIGEPALAGFYAEEAANLEGTGEAWGIAGTTYTLCAQGTQNDKTRSFCVSRAVKAFESAISLAPEEFSHRLNLALVYADFPPPDDAMKGILMLRDLETRSPDNPSLLFHLGRLAIRTGQWERAIERLERATELEPQNQNAWCMLAQAYQQTGNRERFSYCQAKCDNVK